MKQIISRVLLGFAAVLCIGVTARAAGINSAEQKVLDEISQPFSYNGKTYIVNSGSISAAKAKLSEDSMDLTDSFADDCISQFRQSYEEVVSGGYCTETESSDDNDTEATDAPEVTPETKHSKSERAKNKEFLAMMFGSPEEGDTSKEEDSDEDGTENDSDKADESEKKKAKKESESLPSPTPDEWEYEKDTLPAMEFDKHDITNAVASRLTVTQGSREINIQKERAESSAQKHAKRYLSLWKKALIGMFIFTVIVLAGAVDYIFAYRGRRDRKRERRRMLAVLTGICTGGWSLLILLAFGLNFGVFNKGAMHRQLMESDYFSGVTQMACEQAAGWLQDNSYDRSIADDVFNLSNIYIEEKQYIDAVLSGEKDAEVSVNKIHEKLTEKLDEDKDETLISLIEEEYKSISDFELGSIVRNSKDSCTVFFYLTVIAGIAIILILFGVMYYIYGYLHKAVGVAASGLLPASLLVVMVAFMAKYAISKQELKIKPVYYQEFLQNYLGWDIQVVLYLGCIGTVCALGLILWRIHMHKIYEG